MFYLKLTFSFTFNEHSQKVTQAKMENSRNFYVLICLVSCTKVTKKFLQYEAANCRISQIVDTREDPFQLAL